MKSSQSSYRACKRILTPRLSHSQVCSEQATFGGLSEPLRELGARVSVTAELVRGDFHLESWHVCWQEWQRFFSATERMHGLPVWNSLPWGCLGPDLLLPLLRGRSSLPTEISWLSGQCVECEESISLFHPLCFFFF